MVVLQTVAAPGDGPGPAREGFVIEPGIRDGPIEVLPGQGLSAELSVVGDPALPFVIPLCSHYCGLVGQQFRCLGRETRSEYGRHEGVPLDPLGYFRHGETGRRWGAPRGLGGVVVDGDL